MTDDMTSLMNRLEARTPGQEFLSLEDLANENRFQKVPIEINQIRPGMWYDWGSARFLMVVNRGGAPGDTMTIDEVIAHKKDCFVFDVRIEGEATPELVKRFDYLQNYNPGEAHNAVVSSRQVVHAEEIRDGALFLHDGVFYLRQGGLDAIRCDTNSKVRLSSLDSTVFDVIRQDSRSETMVMDLNSLGGSRPLRGKKWQYGATWALAGALIAASAAVIGVNYWHTDVPVSTEPIVVNLDMGETLDDCQKRDRTKDAKITDLQSRVDDLTRGKDECGVSLARSERVLADVTVEYANLIGEHEICRANYADCDAQIRVVYVAQDVSQADVSRLSSENSGLNSDLHRVREEYAGVLAAKGKCEGDLETARGSAAAIQVDKGVVSDVTSKYNQCVADLGRSKSENDAVQGKYDTCVADGKKKDGSLASLRGELVSVREERDALKQGEGDHNLVLKALRGTLSTIEKERDAVRVQYNTCNTEESRLRADNARLTSVNTSLAVADFSSTCEDCSSRLDVMTASLDQCGGERDAIRVQYNSCVAEKGNLVTSTAADAKAMGDKFAALNETHVALNEKYDALDKKYTTCDAEEDRLRAEAARLSAANTALGASDVSSKYGECTTRLSAMTASLEQCGRERAGVTDLRAQILSLRGVIKAKDALLGTRQQTIDQINGQLGIAQGRIITIGAERDSYSSKVDLLNGNVHDLNGTIGSLRGDLGTCVASRDAFSRDLDLLREDRGPLERELVAVRFDYEVCRTDLVDAQSRPAVVAVHTVPLTPGAMPSGELDLCGDSALRDCYVARDTAITERDLATSAKARYDFIRERLGQSDVSSQAIDEVGALVTRWIHQTCSQKDARCIKPGTAVGTTDRFYVRGNSFGDAAMQLYVSIVGDVSWKDGENDLGLARKYILVAAQKALPLDGRTVDSVVPGDYGFN